PARGGGPGLGAPVSALARRRLVARRREIGPRRYAPLPGAPLTRGGKAARPRVPGVAGAGTGWGDVTRRSLGRHAPPFAAHRTGPGHRPQRGALVAFGVGGKFFADPVPEVLVRRCRIRRGRSGRRRRRFGWGGPPGGVRLAGRPRGGYPLSPRPGLIPSVVVRGRVVGAGRGVVAAPGGVPGQRLVPR